MFITLLITFTALFAFILLNLARQAPRRVPVRLLIERTPRRIHRHDL